MKAQVTYIMATSLDRVFFDNEEDRLAYLHVEGLVYLPRYPKVITLPKQEGVISGIVEAKYLSIEEFISSPPQFLSEYAGRGVNAMLAKMERDFYLESSAAYRMVYSLFESHIAIACIFVTDPLYIY